MAFEGEITLVPAEALGIIIIKLRELRQIHPQSPHPSPGVQPARSEPRPTAGGRQRYRVGVATPWAADPG